MKYIIYLLLLTSLTTACTNDDYLTDGGIASPYVNMTTYDYLKSNPLFDTLVMAIDIAGLQDEINAAGTFYAPTNYSMNEYIRDELSLRRQLDADAVYTFDSIPVTEFDSIRMYIFAETITRDSLTEEGRIYTSSAGIQFKLSKEPQSAYQDDLVIQPEYLYFIKKIGSYFDTYEDTVNDNVSTRERDVRIRVQTSGLISTTGIIHVLQNSHKFIFHEAVLN